MIISIIKAVEPQHEIIYIYTCITLVNVTWQYIKQFNRNQASTFILLVTDFKHNTLFITILAQNKNRSVFYGFV